MREQIGNAPSPFERLGGLFDKIPHKPGDEVISSRYREVKLGDNTNVYIFKGIVGTIDVNDEVFTVHIEPSDKSVNPGIQFSIIQDGLLSLTGPKSVVLRGGILLTGEDAKNLNPAENQDRLALAGKLVDWTSEIMVENKYTPLPTASFV